MGVRRCQARILHIRRVYGTIKANYAPGGDCMQYQVLALDLDGTLTNRDKIITPRTKAALQ